LQIIHDINCLATEVCGDYVEHVLQLLSSCSADVLDLVKQSILQGGKSLNDLTPLAINAITDALVDEAVKVSCIWDWLCLRMLGFLLAWTFSRCNTAIKSYLLMDSLTY